jgi:phosphoribosylformylglycinamidine synthase PurS subunit
VKAIVRVDLKPGVLDPQGKAVAHALQGLGFDEVENARQGKVIEIDLKGQDRAAAEKRVKEMCEALLANTVIERYAIEIADGA